MEKLLIELKSMIDKVLVEFRKEINSDNYNHFNECPSYGELKALLDSANVMRRHLGYRKVTISSMLEEW